MATGYQPDVIAGAPIASSWGNKIRDRSVMVFATTAERDASIPAPSEGMNCYVVATKFWYVHNGAVWEAAPMGPRVYSAVTTGAIATGSAEITLGTVNVPAQPRAGAVVATAFASGRPTVSSDEFQHRIRVAGVDVGAIYTRAGAINARQPWTVPTTTPYALAAATPVAVTFTGIRTAGTGGLVADMAGVLTVTFYPGA